MFSLKYRKKEFVFDIILSVGDTCRVAYYLKKHGLRYDANPLDWMKYYSLDTVIHLYQSKFNDFFVDFTEDKQKNQAHTYYYHDSKNDIVSLHYADIGTNNKAFREKIEDRFERIHKILLNADKIGFISCRNEDIFVFRNFLNEMGKLYPGKITCINIKNNKKIDHCLPGNYLKERVSEKLTFIEYEFNDVHPAGGDWETNIDSWIGNYMIWDRIIKKISVKKRTNFFLYLYIKIFEVHTNIDT